MKINSSGEQHSDLVSWELMSYVSLSTLPFYREKGIFKVFPGQISVAVVSAFISKKEILCLYVLTPLAGGA